MKKKELKALAQKIAKAELIIASSSNAEEVKRAKDLTMTLCSHVDSLEDIMIIDEMVQEILKEKI